MKKVVVTCISTICILLLVLGGAAAYFTGDYLVNYALRRGNAQDPLAPPQAYTAAFSSTDGLQPRKNKPNFDQENWQVQSFDGLNLKGTHFQPRALGGHQWVILMHGYSCDQSYMWNMAEVYLRHGYQVLTPDQRACGSSEGRYITMGALEGKDVVSWAQAILAHDPEAKIVLHGVSMGAATVMLATAEELPDAVKAAVEDCGYTDALSIFAGKIKNIMGVPGFPVLNFMDWMSKKRTGVQVSAAAPLTAVTKTKIPMLFIHSRTDKMIPYAMMEQLYAASKAPVKEQLTIKEAGHAMSYLVAPEIYFKTVFAFSDRFTAK